MRASMFAWSHALLAAAVMPPGSLSAQSVTGGPFTLIEQGGRDPNGFLLNPRWRTSENPLRLDPAKRCGILGVGGGAGSRPVVLRNPECFDSAQRAILRLNEPQRIVRFGGAICGQAFGDGWPQGHVNWFPVTMSGVGIYNGSLGGKGGDYDFTFELFAENERLMPVTKWNRKNKPRFTSIMGRERQSIHTEVDYRETFVRMNESRGTWWEQFRDLAFQHTDSTDRLFRSGEMIITGLFNLDVVHWGHSELHPIYAMAVLVKADTSAQRTRIRQRWAFFARDRGNEGNCASGVIPLRLPTDSAGDQEFRMNLRAPSGAEGAPVINQGVNRTWFGSTSSAVKGPFFRAAPNQGLQVAVHWPDPTASGPDALIVADLDITWQGSFGPPRSDARQAQVDDLVEKLNRVDKGDLGPAGEEGEKPATGARPPAPVSRRVKHPDEVYYDELALRPVRELSGWYSQVEWLEALPLAGPVPPTASLAFDLWPPVLTCAQLRPSQNPRCRGDVALAAYASVGIYDRTEGSSNTKVGLGIESPRLELLGRNAMFRFDLEYARNRAGVLDQRRNTHRVGIHPALIGRVPALSGVYLVVRPGAGIEWQDATRFYASLAAGLATTPRSGSLINLAIEVLPVVSTHRKFGIDATIRVGYVP